MKKLPIGVSDFKEMIENDFYYIDKSLIIKEILDNVSKALLLPRPRRFGKTLTLSMLKYFFEKHEQQESKSELFKDLKIYKDKDAMEKQGKYPVIFLTLKDLSDNSWKKCFKNLKGIVAQEFRRHNYLLGSDILDEFEKDYFLRILSEKTEEADYRSSLRRLSGYLHKYHKKENKVVLLIDEYDTPIHYGYYNGYYDEIINFMRGFLGGGLKDNSDLAFAVVTGILRISKESIFTGVNNLKVCTLTNSAYSDHFGFLQNEVDRILKDYDLTNKSSDVKSWYNGYNFGGKTVYNPWSILNFVDEKEIKPYWVNTSANKLVKNIIQKAPDTLKDEIKKLLLGNVIRKKINENIIFSQVEGDENVLWSFLLFTGYLKYENKLLEGKKTCCDCSGINS
jgi:hypothetical protein